MQDNFKTVTVKFKNPIYNYQTSVGAECSDSEISRYFVGQWFNVGVYPVENMQQCCGIEILTPSNQFPAVPRPITEHQQNCILNNGQKED